MEESYLNPYYFQVAFEREPLYTSKDMESPEPFSQTLNGLIYLSSYDEDGEPTNEEDEIIGAFRLQFINGSLAEEYPVNLFEIFDLEQETLDYYEDVIDVCKNEYRKTVEKALDYDLELAPKTVLILDRIGIIPEYRNNKIGQYIIRNIIERYSMGAFMVAVKPVMFPFDKSHIINDKFGKRINWETGDESADNSSLIRFYKKQGFKKSPGMRFMVLCTEQRLPELD